MPTNGAVLHHDNSLSQTAEATVETIQNTVQILPHLITIFFDCSQICFMDSAVQTKKNG